MLTDAQCRNATCSPGAKRERFSDSGGLYLEVSPAGSRRWFWKYRLDGNEGRLTASIIADRIGITRSVIVNALRKLESAGIIESRSLGMKGTYIKVINEGIFDKLKDYK